MILNVSEKGNEISFVRIDDDDDDIVNVSIQAIFYPTVQSLVDSINAEFKSFSRCNVSFTCSDITQRSFMVFKKTSKYSVSLGRDIAQILGFHAHTPHYATPEDGLKSIFSSGQFGPHANLL